MKKFAFAFSTTLLFAAAMMTMPLAAQKAATDTVSVELKTKVDTKIAKVGDKVAAVTTSELKADGKVLLPKGSKLSGTVTAVTAAPDSKSPATLAIAFNQAITPKGQTITLRGGISSVAVGEEDTAEPTDQASLAVAIAPAAGGATQLTAADGNFKLDSGRHVQLALVPSGAAGSSVGDRQ